MFCEDGGIVGYAGTVYGELSSGGDLVGLTRGGELAVMKRTPLLLVSRMRSCNLGRAVEILISGDRGEFGVSQALFWGWC